MTEISAKAVGELRAKTGVSILAVKKALEEAGGDEAKAIEILRSRGEAQAVKKSDREQGEGFIFKAEGEGKSVLVKILCETDFVARNDDFQAIGNEIATIALEQGEDAAKDAAGTKLPEAVQQLGENISLGEIVVTEGTTVGSYVHTNGKIGVSIALDGSSADVARDVAMHAAAMNPEYTSPEEVSDETVEKEKEIWAEQLKDEGKPAEIMENIMKGKENKFRSENSLIKQAFVKNPDVTVEQYIEGANVTSYNRLALS